MHIHDGGGEERVPVRTKVIVGYGLVVVWLGALLAAVLAY
jgi:hypothetical protein